MTARFIRLNWTPGETPPQRSRLLERLLLGAERREEADWRAAAFRVLGPATPMPGIAAARLQVCGLQAHGYACLASAVHYVAELSNVRLDAHGLLALSAAEAALLAQDFNRVWHEGEVHMIAAGEIPCLLFKESMEVRTWDPAVALGRHVDGFLPSGKDAQRLRALASETEMWLFDHPVNRARAARHVPLINGLWLWGGGEVDPLPPLGAGASGDDVFFDAYPAANLAAARVLVTAAVPGSAAWLAVENGWLAAVARALGRGEVSRLEVSVRDRVWQIDSGRRWKIWRRSKPWWQTLDDAADD